MLVFAFNFLSQSRCMFFQSLNLSLISFVFCRSHLLSTGRHGGDGRAERRHGDLVPVPGLVERPAGARRAPGPSPGGVGGVGVRGVQRRRRRFGPPLPIGFPPAHGRGGGGGGGGAGVGRRANRGGGADGGPGFQLQG